MAIDPRIFVFTKSANIDPASLQQAAILSQIEGSLREAAMRNQTAAQVARENAAQQRYLTQSQMSQNDKYLAQRENESLRQADLQRQDLAARRDYEIGKDKRLTSDVGFNTVQTLIGGTNIPTKKELEGLIAKHGRLLTDQDKELLRANWQTRFDELNHAADLGEGRAKRWTAVLKSLKPDDLLGVDRVVKDALRQDGKIIDYDPDTKSFVSLYKRPRVDVEDVGFVAPPVVAPPTAAQMYSPEEINQFTDVIRNALQKGVGSFISGIPQFINGSQSVPQVTTPPLQQSDLPRGGMRY